MDPSAYHRRYPSPFDFWVTLTSYLIPQGTPLIWIRGNDDPTYRGGLVKEVETLEPDRGTYSRRTATSSEIRSSQAKREARSRTGVPPWGGDSFATDSVEIETESVFEDLRDSEGAQERIRPSRRTLEDWAEDYCQSWRPIKTFRFRKGVYGWDLDWVETSAFSVIKPDWLRTIRHWTRKVEFSDVDDIVIQHDFLSPIVDRPWVQEFLWMTFLYPLVIWPMKRYLLTAHWDVAGASYPFQRWVHLDDSHPGETVNEYQERPEPRLSDLAKHTLAARPILKETPRGISQLVGTKWEDARSELRNTVGYSRKDWGLPRGQLERERLVRGSYAI